MEDDSLVGALAISTLGIVIVVAGGFYLRSLKSSAAKNTLVEDGSSAHTAVRGGNTPDHLK